MSRRGAGADEAGGDERSTAEHAGPRIRSALPRSGMPPYRTRGVRDEHLEPGPRARGAMTAYERRSGRANE